MKTKALYFVAFFVGAAAGVAASFKYAQKKYEKIAQEEIDSVKEAVVVPSQYGNSVCFMLKAGGQVFLPLSNDSNVGVGESVDLTKAKLLTLEKDGEKDIQRVRV